MSTSYYIVKRDGDNGTETLEAVESSGKVSLELWRENENGSGDGIPIVSTEAVFESADLIQAAVELVQVASYISSDPEGVVDRLFEAIEANYYLRSMLRKRERQA